MHRSSTIYKQKQSKSNSKQIYGWILMWKDSRGWTFSLVEVMLWICILARRRGLMLKHLDGFVSYKYPQDVNWWTGAMWIIVMFLSSVWTLILTAPIHCRGSIDEQVMEWYISPNLFPWTNKHIYILDGLKLCTFSGSFNFGWTISLMLNFIMAVL